MRKEIAKVRGHHFLSRQDFGYSTFEKKDTKYTSIAFEINN